MALTPEQRSQRARLAALTRWSRESGAAQMARAQDGLFQRFRREVEAEFPDLPEAELERRALARRRAHMTRLAYQSSRARSRRAAEPDALGGDAA